MEYEMKFKEHASITHLLSLKIADATGDIFIPDLIDDVLLFTSKYDSFYVLSGGTNVVVKESVLPILYMGKPLGNSETRNVDGEDDFIIVQMPAGISNSALLSYCMKNGLTGLEFLAGIPGRVGGAIYGNAAPKGYSWADAAVAILAVSEGEMIRFEPQFAYRSLLNKPAKYFVITAVELLLKKSSKEHVHANILSFLKKRTQIKLPSVGSLFKNPSELPSAGELLDGMGMKGYRIGDAGMSESHANIMVNYGNASAQEFYELRDYLKDSVEEKHSFLLETEVAFWENR